MLQMFLPHSPSVWMLRRLLCCCCSVAKLCPTLCDPMDYSLPGSMMFSRQESWSWLPFPFLEDLLDPGIESVSCRTTSPALTGRFFTAEPPGKPCRIISLSLKWTKSCMVFLSFLKLFDLYQKESFKCLSSGFPSGVPSSFLILAFVSFAQFLLWTSMCTVVCPFGFIPLGFSSAFSEDLGLSPHLQIQSSVVSILSITIIMRF